MAGDAAAFQACTPRTAASKSSSLDIRSWDFLGSAARSRCHAGPGPGAGPGHRVRTEQGEEEPAKPGTVGHSSPREPTLVATKPPARSPQTRADLLGLNCTWFLTQGHRKMERGISGLLGGSSITVTEAGKRNKILIREDQKSLC